MCTYSDQKDSRRPGKIWKVSTAADLLFLPLFSASRPQGSTFHKRSRRQIFEQELTEVPDKLVFHPDIGTKWPSLSHWQLIPGNNLAKPELLSLRSLRSLCLRILSSRPPVEPTSVYKRSRRQIFEQELTEVPEKLVFHPDIGTKWPSLSHWQLIPATTR